MKYNGYINKVREMIDCQNTKDKEQNAKDYRSEVQERAQLSYKRKQKYKR